MVEAILIIFGIMMIIAVVCLIYDLFILDKSIGFPSYKYPFPPPCKPNNHDFVPNGYDNDSDYFKCRICGQEKRENFIEKRL